MSRRYQLRSLEASGTRLRGLLTNLDWKSDAQGVLHAGFDLEIAEVTAWSSSGTAREKCVALIAYLKTAGALLPDAETDLPQGAGAIPIEVLLGSLPPLPSFV